MAHEVLSVVPQHGYNELGEQTMEQHAPVSNFPSKCHLGIAVVDSSGVYECKAVPIIRKANVFYECV